MCFLPYSQEFQNNLGKQCRALGIPFQPCQSMEEATVFAAREKDPHFIFFGDSRSYNALVDFSKIYPASKIVVVLQDSFQKMGSTLGVPENIRCFVSAPCTEADLRELILLLQKLHTNRHPRLEKYLGFPCVLHKEKILNSVDKKRALTSLEGFILNIGKNNELFAEYAKQSCELALELFPQKKDVFELGPDEIVQIKWGFDGDVFGLSITIQTELENQNQINIPFVFQRTHHFIINTLSGKTREMICLIHFEKTRKEFEDRLKSIHYF